MGAKRKVYRSGNSLVVAIPEWIWADLGVGPGDYVEVIPFTSDGFISIRKAVTGKKEKTPEGTDQEGGGKAE